MIGVAGESYPLATFRYQSDQLPRSQFLANSRLADDSEPDREPALPFKVDYGVKTKR